MSKSSKTGVLSLFAFLCALLLASCQGSPLATSTAPLPAPPTPTDTSPAAPPASPETAVPPSTKAPGEVKRAVIAFVQEFDSLNPLYAQALSSLYTQQIWNCRAWLFDDQNNPVPQLVEAIPSTQNGGISADGRTITLKLRPDVIWSDGTPLTAQDFVFTYQMILDPNNGAKSLAPYDLVESVTAPDERTVVVTFEQPYAPWLSALWHSLLPAHVLQPIFEAEGTLQNAPWNRAPTVGCGPFVFQEWKSSEEARFVANERYWFGRPKLDEVVVRFVASDAAKVEALKSGQAHLSVFLINSALYMQDIRNAGLTVIPANAGYNEGWFFYLDPQKGHPALQDVRVRQALAMALDRERLIRDLLGGGQRPVATYWDNTPYNAPDIQPWPYDPERARQLLDEAGWVDRNGDGVREKEGVDLALTYGTTTNPLRQAVQRMVRIQLNELGIALELLDFDAEVFFAGYNEGGPAATGQLDIFQYAPRTKNYPDPGTNDFLCAQIPSVDELGENWSWLCDETLDALLQLQATQMDFQERQETFHKISKLIFEQVYFLGLWSDPDIWAATPNLRNVRLSGVTPFFNIAEWEIAP